MLGTRVSYSRYLLPLVVPMGLGPERSLVAVDSEKLIVKMGWAFGAEIPLSSIASSGPVTSSKWWWGSGVHRIARNTWIVNGTLQGLVEVRLRTPVRARTLGIGIWVERLIVSVDDPDAIIDALAAR